ncbi:MAG: bifunctional adenosylcobinamide kinase/adenosylcobinamide-phosphate guanylyltransferase, partial [Rhodoferax sp.]
GCHGLEFKKKVPETVNVYESIAIVSGAIRNAPGPVVLVSNEIGLGVIPLGREVRAFVDALGRLNQDVAQACERVTLMVAGLPVPVKGIPGDAA